jgi:outer membrane protein OmpA-like peptidoglycan-associated protein
MLIGNVRIAAGGRDLYDVLAADGRFTARGIQFEVNSASIRPESAEILAEIGTMLQKHPELRLSIEGHTDADGDDQHNLVLSKQRAVSVVDYLVDTFGVDAPRLEAQGFGETAPVAPNDTPEGKQENRRVELVRR